MSTADPLVGHTVGRFKVESYLMDEQLGKVYAARQLPGNELVTLKVVHPHLAENREVMGRFGREMLASATINHPNTVQMLDFGDHRGVFHFIVFEGIDARTVREDLDANGPMRAERAAHIAAQVCRAMTAAHHEGIVHRNLNSSTILLLNNVLEGDYVKVRDFGFARLENEGGGEGLTAVGARVGTTAYMAPEYITENIVDPRGDLYALGVLMFEMVTGQPPFTGRAGEVLEMHVSEPVPRPSSKVAGIPGWFDEIVLKLLEKEPELRTGSAADLLQALQGATKRRLESPHLTQLDEQAAITRRQTASSAPLITPARIAVALGMLILVGAVGMVLVTVAALLLAGSTTP